MARDNDYWSKRFEAVENNINRAAEASFSQTMQIHNTAVREIDEKISRWYRRLAANNEISMADARRLLRDDALAEFKWGVQEYIRFGKENAVNQQWMRQLENVSAKQHITELEARKIELQQVVEKMHVAKANTVNAVIENQFTEALNQSMFEMQRGLNTGFEVNPIDRRKLEQLMQKPWTTDKLTFSDRLWREKEKVINEIHDTLTKNILLGKNADEMVKELTAKIGKYHRGKASVLEANVRRILRTESSAFSAMAQKEVYEQLGVERFKVVATLDLKTSDICQDMDGQVFEVRDFQIGVTANPFHPNCRTTTVPYYDDNDGMRAARDPGTGKTYYVPNDMKYKEWKETFVDNPEAKRYNVFKNAVQTRIINGEFALTVNSVAQNRHVQESPNFDASRGTLTADPQALIDLYAGKGAPIRTRRGEWNQRERFAHTEIIGMWRDKADNELPTNRGIIHYTKTKGAHIVPSNPEWRD